tara:strand:- start:1994 stop:3229 length:1236 start_codon:yes stop_codon:yes gene_type:complete
VATLPLQGVRVIDLTWIIAGPTATRFLGDFGADVIKIEHEQAVDPIRLGRPIVGDHPTLNNSGFFNYINRNKRSVLLNVRHPFGMDLLKRLIAVSDVVIENFSAGTLASWDLDYPKLCEIREDIIYCSISGFGHTGRDSENTTWGPTAQALGGLTLTSGLPGKPPAGWGYSFMDHTAGYSATIAILMALHHRNRTGEGQHIDLSQVEAATVLNGPAVLDRTVNGRTWRREGLPPGNRAWEPAVAPHNTYPCLGDDRWIAIAVMTQAEWEALGRAMAEPPWVSDERFASNASRLVHQDILDKHIADWTSSRHDYETMELLQAAGVRAAVCQKPSDRVEKDPQLKARDWWQRLSHTELGNTVHDSIAPRLSENPGALRKASPLIGEHTREVFAEALGLTEAEIDEFMEAGVFM